MSTTRKSLIGVVAIVLILLLLVVATDPGPVDDPAPEGASPETDRPIAGAEPGNPGGATTGNPTKSPGAPASPGTSHEDAAAPAAKPESPSAPRGKGEPPPVLEAPRPGEAALARKVSLDYQDAPLSAFARYIADQTGLDVDLSPKLAKRKSGELEMSLNVSSIPVRTALDLVTMSLGLRWEFQAPNRILITCD